MTCQNDRKINSLYSIRYCFSNTVPSSGIERVTWKQFVFVYCFWGVQMYKIVQTEWTSALYKNQKIHVFIQNALYAPSWMLWTLLAKVRITWTQASIYPSTESRLTLSSSEENGLWNKDWAVSYQSAPPSYRSYYACYVSLSNLLSYYVLLCEQFLAKVLHRAINANNTGGFDP